MGYFPLQGRRGRNDNGVDMRCFLVNIEARLWLPAMKAEQAEDEKSR